MTESELSKRLTKALKNCGAAVLKVHGHTMQQPGWPDFYIAHNGLQAWIETKGVKTPLTLLQRITIRELREQKVNAYVLRFVTGRNFVFEDENGNQLRACNFSTWQESAEQFLSALREVVNGKSNGTGTSTEL